MRHTTTSYPSSFAERQAGLAGLKERLGAKHFGIGAEIDRLLGAFAPWYLFAEAQTRPRTIGLWGMTGTGKSSLVRELVRLLSLEERTYWLDGGECRKDHWLDDTFSRIEEYLNGAPFIVVVDEFQHARTVRSGAEPTDPTALRRFWELLDAGRVVTWSYSRYRHVTALVDLHDRLSAAIEAGVRIHKGRVVRRINRYKDLVARHYRDWKDDEPWAVPEDDWHSLRELHNEPKPSLHALQHRLEAHDGPGTLAFLDEIRRMGQSPVIVDASKILVIVLGNLDELYTTGREPLAELDPDVLLQRHRDIGTAGVQNALLKLFRIEQVARLGTDHVVFPPIGRATLVAMVRSEAASLATALSGQCGKVVVVDDELLEAVRVTSSIAVMGARPVVAAVHRVLPGLLTQALEHPAALKARSIRLGLRDGRPVATWANGKRTGCLELAWSLEKDTATRHTDADLVHLAVHETGHLLCGVLLCGLRPLQVCARTSDAEVGGFVIWDQEAGRLLERTRMVARLAMMLGGWAAETLHFGPEGITTGTDDDLAKASAFALDMVKRQGFGTDRLHHAEHPGCLGGGFRTTLSGVEAQARQWIEAAETLALDTLREHKAMFDACAERLREKGSLGREELEELLRGPAKQKGFFEIAEVGGLNGSAQ